MSFEKKSIIYFLASQHFIGRADSVLHIENPELVREFLDLVASNVDSKGGRFESISGTSCVCFWDAGPHDVYNKALAAVKAARGIQEKAGAVFNGHSLEIRCVIELAGVFEWQSTVAGVPVFAHFGPDLSGCLSASNVPSLFSPNKIRIGGRIQQLFAKFSDDLAGEFKIGAEPYLLENLVTYSLF